MKVWSCEDGYAAEEKLLWKALRLPVNTDITGQPSAGKTALVISLTGGGGKTSTMYRLADELAVLGCRVIVTTTTHICYPSDRQVLFLEQAEEFPEYGEAIWEKKAVAVVGRRSARAGKMTGLSVEETGKLRLYADVLLIEADGARCMPFKIPRETEPVLVPETDVVIGCAGLDCVGRTWEEACFCYTLASEVLGAQVEADGQIHEKDVADVLLSEGGTRKGLRSHKGMMSYRIVLNKADDDERLQMGMRISAMIKERENITCVISHY